MANQIIIPTAGDIIAGRYQVIEELGRGSYGVVYRARETERSRDVALKTLLPQSFLDQEVIDRFEREAMLVARMRHRNVIALYDYGQHEGLLYMAMEYVEGRRLSDLIEAEAPIDPALAQPLCAQILDALHYAHAQGVVHRDLKPDNILLLRPDPERGLFEETVKILDFGIAKVVQDKNSGTFKTLTAAGDVLGTPHYMSPEAIVGDEITIRSDFYSFGIIVYEMLTHTHPFDAPNPTAVLVRHLRDEPAPLSEPLERSVWGEVVRRCLSKQPEDRFASSGEIKALILAETAPMPLLPPIGAASEGGAGSPQGPGAVVDDATLPFFRAELPAQQPPRHQGAGGPPPPLPTARPEPVSTSREIATRDTDTFTRLPRRAASADPLKLGGAALLVILALVLVVGGWFWLGGGDGEEETGTVAEDPVASVAPTPADVEEEAAVVEPPREEEEAVERREAAEMASGQARDLAEATAARAGRVGVALRAAADEREKKRRDGRRNAAREREEREEAAATVKVRFESTPPGARVSLSGRDLGRTPLAVELPRSGSKSSVTFSLFGYDSVDKSFVPSHDRHVRATLHRGRLELGP